MMSVLYFIGYLVTGIIMVYGVAIGFAIKGATIVGIDNIDPYFEKLSRDIDDMTSECGKINFLIGLCIWPYQMVANRWVYYRFIEVANEMVAK